MNKKKKFIVALDQGTTSTRAILFDVSGKSIFKSQLEINVKDELPKRRVRRKINNSESPHSVVNTQTDNKILSEYNGNTKNDNFMMRIYIVKQK